MALLRDLMRTLWRPLRKTFVGRHLGRWVHGNRRMICGQGNHMELDEGVLEGVNIQVHGDFNTLRLGKGCYLKNVRFVIYGSHHRIEIGEGCRLNDSMFWMEDQGSQIRLGKGVTGEGATHFAATEGCSITIGDDCMFAYDIDIRTGDSHTVMRVSDGQRVNPAGDVQLGNHVWVAPHVSILKGVVIGNDAIIGIQSVVTQEIPAEALAAGAPAVVRKRGISWKRERIAVEPSARSPSASKGQA